MNTKESGNDKPIVIRHWKNKFDKAIRILSSNGYGINDLIERIREVLMENEKSDQNNRTTT